MAKETKRKQVKYTPEQKQEALALLHVYTSKQVSEMLHIPSSTVRTWEKALKESAGSFKAFAGSTATETVEQAVESVEFADESKNTLAQNARTQASSSPMANAKFIDGTEKLALKALDALNARIELACSNVQEIGELKKFILDHKEEVLTGKDREVYSDGAIMQLLKKLETLEVIRVGELSTVLGVAYDKHALASGKPTERLDISFEDYPE